MARIILIPYKMGSASCKLLKEKLIELGQRCLRIKEGSRTFKQKASDFLVKWGGNQVASNKLSCFRIFKDNNVETVPWTDKKEEIPNEWKTVVSRSTLTGHSGAGITIHERQRDNTFFPELPTAPLYTGYVKKTYECRVHVFNGKVIDAQIKRRVRNHEGADTHVRNIHTGWVYCRDDFVLPEPAADLALLAVKVLNLQFGAVDLIYNQHYNKFYVLEVNTAPGLNGTTLINYANAIISKVNNTNG